MLVFSITCPVCDENWPYWDRILARLDTRRFRVLALNLSDELPSEYVAKYNLSRIPVLARVSADSILASRLRFTPQTILANSTGEVRRVWSGLLNRESMDEISQTLRLSSDQSRGRKPPCVGLRCYDDSDCGSKCRCRKDEGESLGTCVQTDG